jgi:hypothetical protein
MLSDISGALPNDPLTDGDAFEGFQLRAKPTAHDDAIIVNSIEAGGSGIRVIHGEELPVLINKSVDIELRVLISTRDDAPVIYGAGVRGF